MERSELVDLLYDGVTDEQAMVTAVQEFIRRTNSAGSQFGILHRDTGATAQAVVVGFDSSDLQAYLTRYSWRDPRWPLHVASPGEVITIPENLPDRRSFDRSSLVNDLLIKRDAYQSMGVAFPGNGRFQSYFYLMRSRSQGEYLKEEVEELTWFLPAIRRTLDLRIKLGTLDSAVKSLSGLVERIATPVLLVNRSGTLIHTNSSGREALNEGRFLVLRNDRVEPRNARLAPSLAALVLGVGRSRPEDLVSEVNSTLPLAGGDGLRAVVSLLKLHSSVGTVPGAEVAVLLKLVEPLRLDVGRLPFVFGLTDAETRLVSGLLGGHSLETLASQWALSRETLKVQLQSLYRKTGTHRQAELIVLIMGFLGTGWLGRP